MELFTQAIKRGLDVYRHRDKYAYFYSAKGQLLTDQVTEMMRCSIIFSRSGAKCCWLPYDMDVDN